MMVWMGMSFERCRAHVSFAAMFAAVCGSVAPGGKLGIVHGWATIIASSFERAKMWHKMLGLCNCAIAEQQLPPLVQS